MDITVNTSKNGQKEQIIVNGKEFLKATPAGKWTHIIILTFLNENGRRIEYIGKSASKENAEKWQPCGLFHEFHGKQDIAQAKIDHPNGEMASIPRGPFTRGGKFYKVPYTDITREVQAIKRGE